MKYLIIIALLLLASCRFQSALQRMVSIFVTVVDEQGYEHKLSINEIEFTCLYRSLLSQNRSYIQCNNRELTILQDSYERALKSNSSKRQRILNDSYDIPFICILEIYNSYDAEKTAFIDDYIQSGLLCDFVRKNEI